MNSTIERALRGDGWESHSIEIGGKEYIDRYTYKGEGWYAEYRDDSSLAIWLDVYENIGEFECDFFLRVCTTILQLNLAFEIVGIAFEIKENN